MERLSSKANFTKRYTNHCVHKALHKPLCSQALHKPLCSYHNRQHFGVSGCDTVNGRKFCAGTGHTCKSSLNSYSKVTSDKHKKLSVILDGSSEAKAVSVKPEPAHPRPPKACKSPLRHRQFLSRVSAKSLLRGLFSTTSPFLSDPDPLNARKPKTTTYAEEYVCKEEEAFGQ